MRNHRSFLFGKHKGNRNVFDAGVVAAGEFREAGDLQVSMFRRVGFCPGSEVFQRLRNKTISLPSMVDAAAEYEFRFDYTSGDITLPSGVLVANDATFSPTAGMTYQVVICGGILYFSETTIPS